MASLDQAYKKKLTAAKVVKRYRVPINEIFIKEGFNIRPIDDDTVKRYAQAYKNGDPFPPITVKMVGDKFQVQNGHHRFSAVLYANEHLGAEIVNMEVTDGGNLSEADELALMATADQGKPLEPLERAAIYARYKAWGWENKDIAEKLCRSFSDIVTHLELLNVSEPLKQMINDGKISASGATQLTRQHGDDAANVAKTLPTSNTGKIRVSGGFTAKKMKRLVQIVTDGDFDGNDFTIKINPDDWSEMIDLVLKYKGEER